MGRSAVELSAHETAAPRSLMESVKGSFDPEAFLEDADLQSIASSEATGTIATYTAGFDRLL